MWGVLQSSYADVEHEIRVMSGVPDATANPPVPPGAYRNEKLMFAAGDGLAIMRLNHLLANKPDLYVDQTPVIIPIQGARANSRGPSMQHAMGYLILCACQWWHPNGMVLFTTVSLCTILKGIVRHVGGGARAAGGAHSSS